MASGVFKVKSWVAGAALTIAVMTVPLAAHAQQFSEVQKSTGVGALIGGGTGAIVGAAVHHPIVGTLIGAGIGGVGGYAVGHQLQNQQIQNDQNENAVRAEQSEITAQRHEIQQLQQEQDVE